MALRTSVIVREVKNLSDARYCAGMGVDMIGFCIDKNSPTFIEPEKVKEIAGWLAGIKLMAEVKELSEENTSKISDLDPEIILSEKINTTPVNHPLFLKINFDPSQSDKIYSDLLNTTNTVSGYLLENDTIEDCLKHKDILSQWCKEFTIYIGFGISESNIDKVLGDIEPAGISLKGGDEISPGLSNFDELADILETLEILD